MLHPTGTTEQYHSIVSLALSACSVRYITSVVLQFDSEFMIN